MDGWMDFFYHFWGVHRRARDAKKIRKLEKHLPVNLPNMGPLNVSMALMYLNKACFFP